MKRASALLLVERQIEARRDFTQALKGFRRLSEPVWEARTLYNLGWVELRLGAVEEAQVRTTAALRLFESHGFELEALWARQNLGEIAFCRGDLPRALAVYDEVAVDDAALGQPRAHLATARSTAYFAAGLSSEAAAIVHQALSTMELLPLDRANLELIGSAASLASDDAEGAVRLASQARREFKRQGNDWSEARARLAVLRARQHLRVAKRYAGEAREIAEALHKSGADEAPVALMLAAELGHEELLDRAAGYRHRPAALVRASGWLAQALVQERADDRGGTLRACGSGLDALDEHRQTLGSSELRALATSHGSELAAVALRQAATSDARTLLRWSERWRATALAQPPVTPDEEEASSLAALRDNGRRLAAARAANEPSEQLDQERRRLEREVRAEHHRLAGRADRVDPRLDVERLVAEVGDTALVELVDVDGVLHVIVVSGGRVRRRIAGTTEEARELGKLAGFVLRRAARGRPYDPGDLGQPAAADAAGRRGPAAAGGSGRGGADRPAARHSVGAAAGARRPSVQHRAVGGTVAAGDGGHDGRRSARAAGRARARHRRR